MTAIKTIKSERIIQYELNYAPTEKRGLKVYQLKRKDSAKPGTKPTTGFAFLKNLKDPANVVNETRWLLVKQEMLDELQQHGWGGKNKHHSWANHIYANPWQAMKEGKGILVRDGSSHHTFYNTDDEPYPVGMHFSYIDGNICNAAYDLELVMKVLKKRDDIKWLGEEEGIEEIPYYNREFHNSETINFLWQPSAEDWLKVWRAAKTDRHWHLDRYQAVFDQDLLGLRAAGAAKYDNFWERDRSEERFEY